MGIPDNFTCLLRNMQVKIQQLELDREQQTSSKLGKEYAKTEYCLPAYLITSFNSVLTIGLGFRGGSAGKESAFNAEDLGSIPGLGRSPEGNGYPSSILAWRIPWTMYYIGLQSWTRLSDFHFHFNCRVRITALVFKIGLH